MSKVPPPTMKDAKMARAHLKESVMFNKDHAKDHLKAMRGNMNKKSMKYNKTHMKDHMKEAKKAQKLLSGKYSRVKSKG